MEFSFGALLFSNGSGVNGLELERPMTIKRFFEEYPWIIMLAAVVIVALVILLIVTVSAKRQKTLGSKVKICLVGYEDLFVLYGNKPVLPIPSKDGYSFCGWYFDSACTIPFDSRVPVKKELILYPKWVKEVG